MNILAETVKWKRYDNYSGGFYTKTPIDSTEMNIICDNDTLNIIIGQMEYKIPLEVVYGILYKENLIRR